MKLSLRINKNLDKDIQKISILYGIDKSEVIKCSVLKCLRRINVTQNKKSFLSYIRHIYKHHHKNKGTIPYSIRLPVDLKPLIKYFKNINQGVNHAVGWNLYEEKIRLDFAQYKLKTPPKIEYFEGIHYNVIKNRDS